MMALRDRERPVLQEGILLLYIYSSPSLQGRFLLVWYYVAVLVCEETLQRHSLDLLVLMAEQLKQKQRETCDG